VLDLHVADQKMLLNYRTVFIKSFEVVYLRKNCQAYFYATCSSLPCQKQHFEKKSHIGLCNPPSGSLCLTFREMAESSHEQSARATILNSNLPKP
jgi:hypothetical protein